MSVCVFVCVCVCVCVHNLRLCLLNCGFLFKTSHGKCCKLSLVKIVTSMKQLPQNSADKCTMPVKKTRLEKCIQRRALNYGEKLL